MRRIRSVLMSGLLAAVLLAPAISRAADQTMPPASARPTPVAAPEKPPPPPAPSVTVIRPIDAQGILGRDVRSPGGEDMGRIVDVIVDRGGEARGVVIDFGGFLGVGSRKIVVDWSALHFWDVADKGKSITLDLNRDQVKAAPEYKDGEPIIVLGASGSLEPLVFPQSSDSGKEDGDNDKEK